MARITTFAKAKLPGSYTGTTVIALPGITPDAIKLIASFTNEALKNPTIYDAVAMWRADCDGQNNPEQFGILASQSPTNRTDTEGVSKLIITPEFDLRVVSAANESITLQCAVNTRTLHVDALLEVQGEEYTP